MPITYTAMYVQSEGWITGWAHELRGAIVQERTIEAARASLKEVIELLRAMGVADEEWPRVVDAETTIIAREPITVDGETSGGRPDDPRM